MEGFAVGDTVFGVVMKPFLGTGSLAEYVTVSAAYGVAHVPAGLDIKDAGALGLAGTAAFDSLTALDVAKGETVLVSGATGGVGALAEQLGGEGITAEGFATDVMDRPSLTAALEAAKARFDGELEGLRVQLVVESGVALVALGVATALSVYKPRGRTRHGLRKQRAATESVDASAPGRPLGRAAVS